VVSWQQCSSAERIRLINNKLICSSSENVVQVESSSPWDGGEARYNKNAMKICQYCTACNELMIFEKKSNSKERRLESKKANSRLHNRSSMLVYVPGKMRKRCTVINDDGRKTILKIPSTASSSSAFFLPCPRELLDVLYPQPP
jgi:hypothetical protein